MYDINRQKEEAFLDSYFYQSKNEQGQIIRCELYRITDSPNAFNFSFCIKQKRKKDFPHNQITGKDGLKSLIWAYRCLKDSINFLNWKYPYVTLYVEGDNKRKQQIYEYYLIPLGFKKMKNQNNTLFKKINNF